MILAIFIFAVTALGVVGLGAMVSLVVADLREAVRNRRNRPSRARGFEVLPPVVDVKDGSSMPSP